MRDNYTTEERLIGWTLIHSFLPECVELSERVNKKNLSAFGRIVYGRMSEVFRDHPGCDHGPRMMDAVWYHGVKDHKIPEAYVFACHEAADAWVPFGPTQEEIEELTI